MFKVKKGGRCFNGAHRDAGIIVHALKNAPNYSGPCFEKALCGAEPGLRGYGWAETEREVNCPKCLKKQQ